MRSTTVIAIDPGYDRVGVAVFKGEELLYSDCFTPSTKEFVDRINMIAHELERTINEYKPTELAMETLFFSKNQKTALKVAEARGVILHTCTKLGLSFFEYSPQAVKIAVTGSGNADKTAVITMVERLIKLPPKKRLDDEYDAIALAIAHQANSGLN